MIKLDRIDSLTNFQKNAKTMIGELETSKEPVVLTVNGRAKLVVQDAHAYQELLEEVERMRFVEAVRKGFAELDDGQGVPAEEAYEQMKARYGL